MNGIRVPSQKRLLAAFRDLTPESARLIRKLAHASDGSKLRALIEKHCPETDAYARRCYHDPFDSHMWRRTMALHAIDKLLGTHGVEALGPTDGIGGAPPYEYCNAGDPYTTTLIYTRATDTIRIGCWGDIVEREDKRGEW